MTYSFVKIVSYLFKQIYLCSFENEQFLQKLNNKMCLLIILLRNTNTKKQKKKRFYSKPKTKSKKRKPKTEMEYKNSVCPSCMTRTDCYRCSRCNSEVCSKCVIHCSACTGSQSRIKNKSKICPYCDRCSLCEDEKIKR